MGYLIRKFINEITTEYATLFHNYVKKNKIIFSERRLMVFSLKTLV